MKKILLLFIFLHVLPLQSQITRNKDLEKRLKEMLAEHEKMVAINNQQAAFAAALTVNSHFKRNRLNTNYGSTSLGAIIDGFEISTANYLRAKHHSFNRIPGLSEQRSRTRRNDYMHVLENSKTRRELSNMKIYAGSKRFRTSPSGINLTQGKRALLLLNGVEEIMELALDTEEY